MWAPSQGWTINLFGLARSSAAGQGVLVFLDGLEPLHGLQSLEHGVAVQVIDLVLQAHAEQVARGLVANQVGIQVIRLDDDMVGTLDLAANARDGKTALAITGDGSGYQPQSLSI